jgi:hypothetical protein
MGLSVVEGLFSAKHLLFVVNVSVLVIALANFRSRTRALALMVERDHGRDGKGFQGWLLRVR